MIFLSSDYIIILFTLTLFFVILMFLLVWTVLGVGATFAFFSMFCQQLTFQFMVYLLQKLQFRAKKQLKGPM